MKMDEGVKEISLSEESNSVRSTDDIKQSVMNKTAQTTATFLPSEEFNTFDNIFAVIGEFGRYQKLLYFMFSVTYTMLAMQLFGWVFIGAKASVRCLLPSEVNQSELPEYSDFTQNFTSSCTYVWNGNNISSCDLGYVYDTSNIKYSAVMEWDLVCENKGTYCCENKGTYFYSYKH